MPESFLLPPGQGKRSGSLLILLDGAIQRMSAAVPWGNYEELRPAEIDRIRQSVPIAYVPWGALEWHSYHNPIGLDAMKARGICRELAARTGGVVLPTQYTATDTIKSLKGFPHSIEHTEQVVELVALQLFEQLAQEKFDVIIVATGHYSGGHLRALRSAESLFRQKHGDLALWILSDMELLDGKYVADHAGPVETSLQMYFAPELVDLTTLPAGRSTTLDDDGVWGEDPRTATAQKGAAMLELLLERAVPRILTMMKEQSQ